MEGYTNISGNHEDFDDLDIEGRITLDEWNCEDEETAEQEKTASEREEKRLLSIKVKLDEGGYGYVFSVKTTDHSVRWRCHLCDVLIISQKHVDTHIQSKKHQVKLALPTHPSDLFTRVENKTLVEMPQLAPGEPVPPGFEDVVKRVTQIQATLDSHKSSPLIGLEYVVELTPDERGKEPMYVCMLCDKKGDPRVAMAHITSFNHRSKYIGIHYPTANKAIFNEFPRSKDGRRGASEIVTRICAKIEEKYGRLQPLVVEKDTFETKRDQIMQQIQEERHFKETPDETFVELVDRSILDTLTVIPEEPPAPKPEPKNDIEVKSTFVKGKITCDRSRLRIRAGEDVEDEMKFAKFEPERKRSLGSKKFKYGDPNRKSLSSVSSLSSSSRSRSRSRSFSRSRSRSYSRSRYGRHGWREGKYGRGRWRRSRSGSRGWRRSRSGSRPHSRRSRSGSRHGRRSPDSPGRRYQYGRPYSPKYSRYRENQNDDRYKFRDKLDREKSEIDPRILEKTKWMKFRQEVDKIERELAKELKFHEKNPEKHPMYPEEWKKFWNRRYKELQADGKDPSKHDFKPEWIEFWNSRMKEMHEENLKTKKEDLKMKLGLPNEQELMPTRANRKNRSGQDSDVIIISPTLGSEEEVVKKDVTVTDIKNTWKALTGSDIKDSSKRSPSPWEEGEPILKHPRGMSPARKPMRGGLNIRGRGGRLGNRPYFRNNDDTDGGGVVTVLRLLTALENQLGSLGPRVNTLLASALSLEKASLGSSNTLLINSDNFVLLETVKEKLKGQLLAGIVERNMVMATRLCISNLADLLIKAEESVVPPLQPVAVAPKVVVNPSSATVTSVPSVSVTPSVPGIASTAIPAAEPVTVPGVGAVDKIAIAKQIAAALIAQGKTDVTQEELEQLINAVVGMAQASAGSEHPISAATYVSQMQQQLGGNSESTSSVGNPANKITNKSPLQKLLSVVTLASASASTSSTNPINTVAKSEELRTNALALLQSAYEEPKRSPIRQTISNKASVSHKVGAKDPMSIFKNPSPSRISENLDSGHIKHGMEDLSEQDLQTLLQNFKDLSPVEQQGLITYLKKLETIEPEKVEKLRQYVNLEGGGQDSVQNLKSSLKSSSFIRPEQSGRLSPFSLRQGGINPSLESDQQMKNNFSKKESEDQKKSLKLEDSDDDYSFEDIYNAASQKLKEREKAKLEEEKMKQLAEEGKERDKKTKSKSDDPSLILKETKEMIANLMGQLPSKYIQKQSGSPGSRKDSPAVMGHQPGPNMSIQKTEIKSDMELGGQRIQSLGSNTSQMTRPTMETIQPRDSSQHMYQGYSNSESSYNNQYGSQDYLRGQQPYSGPQHSGYSGSYQQSGGYYGNSQQQYPQNPSGSYDAYANHGAPGGNWNQYSDQYGQQAYRHPGPGPYSQYPNQSSGYY